MEIVIRSTRSPKYHSLALSDRGESVLHVYFTHITRIGSPGELVLVKEEDVILFKLFGSVAAKAYLKWEEYKSEKIRGVHGGEAP
jgi:hypothetical protein